MRLFDLVKAKAAVELLKLELEKRDARIAHLEAELARSFQNTQAAIANTDAALDAARALQADNAKLRAQLNGGGK